MPVPAVRLSGVTKRFGAVPALSDVSVSLDPGTVLAVVGQNGAGKSTLVKVLSGVIPFGSYEGAVELDGAPVRFRSPQEAAAEGIAMIPQELSLHPDFTVTENVLVGRLPRRRGLVDWRSTRREARRWISAVGLEVGVDVRVGDLPPSGQQLVAIARGLAREPRLLMLDEPTAALDSGEAERLLAVVRDLAKSGVAIMYISHRLGEVLALADRVAVLRNGRLVSDRPAGETDRRALIAAMLGDVDPPALVGSVQTTRGPPLLRARGIEVRDPRSGLARVANVDLDLHEGEVVGLVGLLGSGRTELLWALFGALPRKGRVEIGGHSLPASPARAVAAGAALLTEERRATGLFPLLDVAGNVSAASLRSLSTGGWLRRGREHALARRLIDQLGVKAGDTRASVTTLSGGNQQKLLLGRWLARDARVLLLDEPGRGVDVAAKAEIYRRLRRLADDERRAILVTSSDVSELVGLCDRYLILWQGSIVAEVPREKASEATLLELAAHGSTASEAVA
jgi:ABC-type sugar transport system ATPase subunit